MTQAKAKSHKNIGTVDTTVQKYHFKKYSVSYSKYAKMSVMYSNLFIKAGISYELVYIL